MSHIRGFVLGHPSCYRAAVLEAWGHLLEGNATFDADYRIERTDGEIRWINDRARLIRDAEGVPERVDGIMRDITERMAARQRINRMTRIRALSSAVNSAIVRLRQRDELLDRICEIATDVGRFESAKVVLVDEAASTATLIAKRGNPSGAVKRMIEAYNAGNGSADSLSQSLRTGQTALSVGREAAAAIASLPLVIKEKVVGALVLVASGQDVFDQDEVHLLEELTANIAFALELIGHQERIDYLAYYDVLTGLSNRTLFNDRLSQALTAAGREDSMLALLVFNVVQLRAVNEARGERAGDAVLREVSQRLTALAGDPARVARLGGDIFALMVPGVRDLTDISQLLAEERFRIFDRPFTVDGTALQVAGRGGVALYPADGTDAGALLHSAEAALDQARSSDEPLLFYSADINARVSEQQRAEAQLRQAVDRQEFELYFQPKLDLHTRRIVGLEALLRWNHPERGLVPPVEFIPLLEETGLILPVGRWTLQKAVELCGQWRAAGVQAPRVAVNVSAIQLKDRGFIGDVEAALAGAGNDGGLDLEITESMLMENVHEGVEKLRTLREMGVQIGIDDFGTGYSSLSYISRLPVNALKIDRSFINGMTEDPDKTSIVSTIISLGHALRMEVVAEGVETEAQSQLLRLLRCDQIQGYLISKPVPAGAMLALLRKGE